MLTHITLELPKVIEAAGLPIVSIKPIEAVVDSASAYLASRISKDSLSLVIRWAATVH